MEFSALTMENFYGFLRCGTDLYYFLRERNEQGVLPVAENRLVETQIPVDGK